MFGRRRPRDTERFQRADVSLVSEVIGALSALRADGAPVATDRLPITVGASMLHADMVAQMPARSSTRDSSVQQFLAKPDPSTDYRAVVHAGTIAQFWHGYAALLLDAPAPFTRAIRVLEPQAVVAQWAPDDPRTVTGWIVDGERIDANMVHPVNLMDDPRRGPLGESPLKRCDGPLSMYGYAYRYLIDYFAQGGNPASILRSTHRLTDTDATALVTEWITARQERRPAVLDPTTQFEVPAASGELAAVLSVLDHAAAEVARMLNMPSSLVNAPSLGYSLTYSNMGDEFRRWLAVSLRPTWIARWESAFRTLTGTDDVYLDPAAVLELFGHGDPLPAPSPLPAPTPIGIAS